MQFSCQGFPLDLNTGGFIEKYPKIYSTNANKNELIHLIIDYSYSLYPFKNLDKKIQNTIVEDIETIINLYSGSWGERFECWISTERVSKFIINSVRAYEFFGYEWWTPYWDNEFVRFWYNVPEILRTGQRLYKEYIRKISNDLGLFKGIDPLFRDGNLLSNFSFERKKTLKNSVQRRLFFLAKRVAKRVLPETMKKALIKYRELYGFQNHLLQWYGIHDYPYVLKQLKKGAKNINAILVIDFVKKMKNNTDETII